MSAGMTAGHGPRKGCAVTATVAMPVVPQVFGDMSGGGQALASQVSSDGHAPALLDRLEHKAIEVGQLSGHVPGPDYVLLAVIAHSAEKEPV